jgi:hypothetical protein
LHWATISSPPCGLCRGSAALVRRAPPLLPRCALPLLCPCGSAAIAPLRPAALVPLRLCRSCASRSAALVRRAPPLLPRCAPPLLHRCALRAIAPLVGATTLTGGSYRRMPSTSSLQPLPAPAITLPFTPYSLLARSACSAIFFTESRYLVVNRGRGARHEAPLPGQLRPHHRVPEVRFRDIHTTKKGTSSRSCLLLIFVL